MAGLEIKGYLQAYKEVSFFLLAGFVLAIVVWQGSVALAERGSLFEPFTAGVVDQDGRPELAFVFNFFNEYVIDLVFLEKNEALQKLSSGEIPAFAELPQDFTSDVFHGINSPFTVHVNSNFPLQASMVQLLASGGIAFLSASQAGVYASLGYAFDAGIPWEEVQRNLLIPVNIAFAQELILYDELFVTEMVALVDGSVGDYFIQRFAVFWHMLSLLALLRFLRGYSAGIMARFRLAGMAAWQVHIIKWSGLFAAVAFMALPIMPFLGLKIALTLSVFVSAFGLLAGRLFKHDGACGLFIFFTALAMYFASGGIIPFVFLPRDMLVMRFLSINYWAANGSVLIILVIGVLISWFSFGLGLKLRRY